MYQNMKNTWRHKQTVQQCTLHLIFKVEIYPKIPALTVLHFLCIFSLQILCQWNELWLELRIAFYISFILNFVKCEPINKHIFDFIKNNNFISFQEKINKIKILAWRVFWFFFFSFLMQVSKGRKIWRALINFRIWGTNLFKFLMMVSLQIMFSHL